MDDCDDIFLGLFGIIDRVLSAMFKQSRCFWQVHPAGLLLVQQKSKTIKFPHLLQAELPQQMRTWKRTAE